jgi:hypothetical protein
LIREPGKLFGHFITTTLLPAEGSGTTCRTAIAMTHSPGRMQREADTVATMIRKYCRLHHRSDGVLCDSCRELLDYSNKRLACCPFQEGKTTCGKCRVHCYQPEMREKIRKVMRELGPTMIFSNPIMAVQHMIDGLRKNPVKKRRDKKKP